MLVMSIALMALSVASRANSVSTSVFCSDQDSDRSVVTEDLLHIQCLGCDRAFDQLFCTMNGKIGNIIICHLLEGCDHFTILINTHGIKCPSEPFTTSSPTVRDTIFASVTASLAIYSSPAVPCVMIAVLRGPVA